MGKATISSNYDFKALSYKDFEDLVRDLLQAEWKVTLESFACGPDQGIDLRRRSSSGRLTVVQCKHYVGARFSQLLSKVRQYDSQRVRKLKPWRYVLVTSTPLTPKNKDRISDLLKPFVRNPQDVLGFDDLNGLLSKHENIARQHIKLWLTSTLSLERFMNRERVLKADLELQRIANKIPLYVSNGCFHRAVHILRDRHAVIIAGEAGVGKTTLAELLLYHYAGMGYEPVIIRSDIEEGESLFDASRKQIFYFDDFLGQSIYAGRELFQRRNEDQVLVRFIELITRTESSLLILTSRECILRDARKQSERFDRGIVTDLNCILALSDYSRMEKARILYNHIYFSDLPRRYRRQFSKPDLYLRLLDNENFTPRYVEWISSYTRVKDMPVREYRQFLFNFLDCPMRIWQHAFKNQISDAARSVLLALCTLEESAKLEKVIVAAEALHRYRVHKYGLRSEPNDIHSALQDLENTFIRYDDQDVSFLNPSVADFVTTTLWTSIDHTRDAFSGASYFEQLRRMWTRANHLDIDPESFHEDLARALQNSLYRISWDEVDRCSWGWRLKFALEIARRLEVASLWDCAESLVEKMAVRPCQDLECFVAILEAFDQLEKNARPQKLREKVKSLLFAYLEAASAAAFAEVDEYSAGNTNWTVADQDRYMVAFERYLRERLEGERERCRNVLELHPLLSLVRDCPAPREAAAESAVRHLEKAVSHSMHRSLRFKSEDSVMDLMEALRESLRRNSPKRRVPDKIGKLLQSLDS